MVGFIIINLFIILILDDSVMDSDEVDGNVDDNIDDSDVTYNNSDKNSDNNDGTTLPAFSESTGVRVDTTGFITSNCFGVINSLKIFCTKATFMEISICKIKKIIYKYIPELELTFFTKRTLLFMR